MRGVQQVPPRPGSQLRSEAQATCHTRPRCPTRLTRSLKRMRRHQRRCHMKLGCWKQRRPGRGRARVQGYEAPHVHAADSELLRQAPGHGAAQAVTAKHHAATQRRAQLATLANAGVQPAPSSSSTGQRRATGPVCSCSSSRNSSVASRARPRTSTSVGSAVETSSPVTRLHAVQRRKGTRKKHKASRRPRPASPGTLREQSFSRNHEGCAGRTAIPAFTATCVTRARYDILRLRQAALKCGTAQAPGHFASVEAKYKRVTSLPQYWHRCHKPWTCIQAAPLAGV